MSIFEVLYIHTDISHIIVYLSVIIIIIKAFLCTLDARDKKRDKVRERWSKEVEEKNYKLKCLFHLSLDIIYRWIAANALHYSCLFIFHLVGFSSPIYRHFE